MGEVEWYYQKAYAENATEHLAGVKGVINQITIKTIPASAEVETAAISAFWQNVPWGVNKSQVKSTGNMGVLRGEVRSHAE